MPMKICQFTRTLMSAAVMAVVACACNPVESTSEPGAGPKATKVTGTTMGTFYQVTIPGEFPGGEDALRQICEETFAKITAAISGFDDKSEISALNADKGPAPHEVSDFLGALIEECDRQGARIDYAMDISVGPLVNLWGFGKRARQGSAAPEPSDIEATRKLVGPGSFTIGKIPYDEKLTTSVLPPVPAAGDFKAEQVYAEAVTALLAEALGNKNEHKLPFHYTVAKRHPGVQLDLATIGEGLGADLVAYKLDKLGIPDYLVAVAGASRSRGHNPRGETWKVGIEDPTVQGSKIFVPVCPLGRALSTAGSYRNFFVDEGDGKFYSHVIDTKSGRPVSHRTVSVSVISDTTLTTDALDTGLLVLGADRALEFAERENVPVYVIELDEKGKPQARYSKNFQPYLDCKFENHAQ